MGHLVALSVRQEREGNWGEDEVDNMRKVDACVLPKKGQIFLKRESVESLSMTATLRL